MMLPILSFSTVALDWEDKCGAADFQDKFSREFILAESTGLQTGNVPLVLGGVVTKDDAEFLRLSRTQFGVAMVHELKIWNDGRTRGLLEAHRSLYKFGYGLDDCKVYRYPRRLAPGIASSARCFIGLS